MAAKEEKKRLVVATGNVNKLREIAEIFPHYEVISAKQAGFEGEVEETGETFAENSRLKAEAVARALGCIALADDSGLCAEALGGAPGVYSARYAGGHGDDRANRLLLLKNMEGERNRRAYFQSAIALVYPDGKCLIAEGRTYGNILYEETGENGFGYDCVFESEDLGKSFGVASAEEKNAVSHRFRALQKLFEMLKDGL
ncbi:MAG: RdgB/HAM1 family non-canonical purine NTP pyrophosphatase [Christensenellaceae bacterium]